MNTPSERSANETQTMPGLLAGPFFSAARPGLNHWWRYALTFGGAFMLAAGVTSALYIPLALAYPSADVLGSAPVTLVLVVTLLPFAAVHLALAGALPLLHRRPLASLWVPQGRFRWQLFFLSGGAWLGLSILVDAAQYLAGPSSYRWSFEAARFWPYMAAALLLLPVQTSAEELLFRGYLMQALGLRARRAWLPLAAPALLFALLHLPNPEVAAYGWLFTLPQYLGIGLLLGWATLRSQGLEMALGLHLANNLYSGLAVGFPQGALPSATLFTVENLNLMLNLILVLLAGLLYLAIAERLILRPRRGLAALLLLGLLAGCTPAAVSPAQPAAGMALQPCLLSAPGLARQVDALCGTLAVPENPAEPEGRQISLNVAVIKAQSSNPAPDPVVLLAGGPGQAATEAYLPILPYLERVTFKRDVILLDQRGTGKSNPLHCDSPDGERPIDVLPGPEETAAEVFRCLQNIDADPRYYTTTLAMQDLEAVRKALGYQQLNLIGVSYGTRAALEYMRLYPQNVRTVVLDAVVPPGWVIGSAVRRDAQNALEQIFARCEADPACQAAFPGLADEFGSLLARLQARPAEVTVPDPTTGADTTLHIGAEIAGAMVRLITYSSDYSALLPYLVHTAAQGDLRPLASQYLLANKSTGSTIEQGLFYAVVCSEDIPFLPAGGEEGDFFFYKIDEIWKAACSAFPPNPQPESARSYPSLQTPALILSGTADPVTPPANGEAAAAYLPNSRHIVLEGMGHGNLQVGCVPNLVRQLMEDASVQQLDPSCIERSKPMPFFVSSIGPEP